MNQKGQVGIWAYALMLSITILVLALSLAPAVSESVSNAMGNSTADFIGLDCDTTTSNFITGTCTILDFSTAYFAGGLLLIGIAVLTAKFIL